MQKSAERVRQGRGRPGQDRPRRGCQWPGPARSDLARLGALAVFACALMAALLPLPLSAGGGRPAWVERFPRDPEAYVGIGRADKRAHPDTYRDLARDAALAQISREISVEVATSAVSARREDAAGSEESFSARTATFSANSLAGYRLEGVHETPDEFWAYYVLGKEDFRAALDAKEKRLSAWIEGEAASLSEELDARRLQAASDRYLRILAAYRSEFEGDALLKGRASMLPTSLPAAMDALSETVRAAIRGTRLESGSARWEFTPSVGADPRSAGPKAHPPRVSLIDGSGRKWTGPFALNLSERVEKDSGALSGKAPCPVATEADGTLDPARAFRECAMEPGRWSVTWEGPLGEAMGTSVACTLRKRDLGVVVLASAAAGPADPSMATRAAADLARALVGTEGRFHRIVGGGAFPAVEIRVREAALDSMDGLFFATLRAEALFPGAAAPVAVRGKAGHADKGRAWARAQGDFAKALNASIP